MTRWIRVLRDEILDEAPSTPGGCVLLGEDRARDIGYRTGWNDRTRALIAQLADIERTIVIRAATYTHTHIERGRNEYELDTETQTERHRVEVVIGDQVFHAEAPSLEVATERVRAAVSTLELVIGGNT